MNESIAGKTYLEEAQGLNEAVTILCKTRSEKSLYAIGILAGHCLELALKSYLAHVGNAEKDMKAIGHDLNMAWDSCKKSGLDLKKLPYWVQLLDYSHSPPYFYRYPRSDHKVAIPNTDELSSELAAVLETISLAIKK